MSTHVNHVLLPYPLLFLQHLNSVFRIPQSAFELRISGLSPSPFSLSPYLICSLSPRFLISPSFLWSPPA